MFLSDLSIRRPVTATVFSIVLVIFGWVGYTRLPIRELPEVDIPIVTVSSFLRGANPEIIEEEVTDIIEEEINTVEGIKHITSASAEGQSAITVEFELERNIDVAAQDVRDKVARIRQILPDDLDEPSIEKIDLDAQAIMWIGVNSDELSQQELTYYADRVLKEQMQKVKGVGSIIVGGQKRFAVRVWLDAEKLAARKMSVSDVIEALESKNVELPSGRIEGVSREFTVKTEGDLKSIEAFNELIIKTENGVSIKLKDIGFAAEGVENERTLARFNSETSVGLGILKQTEANTVEVADRIKKKMGELKKDLPPNIDMEVAYDGSLFIKQSIDEMKETILTASALVVLVIFFFLRNSRSTLIPAIAIPISLISTFAVMYFLGYTLNNFTLLALVLSTGVVVDDAIVMLENIYRHMEAGEARVKAAHKGSSEIAFAVIATSLSLVAVFLPVAFMQGQIGRFFYEFGISVSVAVLVSAFVALTLTPMLCSRFLKTYKSHTWLYTTLEKGYQWLENNYKKGIHWSLNHKVLVLGIALLSFVASGFLFATLGKEFVPSEDQGSFVVILEAPEGSSLEYTDTYLKKIEAILAQKKEVLTFFAALALGGSSEVNKGIMFVQMIPRAERRHMDQFLNEFRGDLFQVTGINAFALTFNPLVQGQDAKTFEYILQHPDMEVLKTSAAAFEKRLKETSGFIEVDTDLELNNPEINVTIDRERAANLGITVRNIADTLNTLLGGQDYTKYKARGERYDVILQLIREDRLTPEVFEQIYVRSDDGRLIRLSNVIKIEEGVGPSVINRFDRMRSVTVSANLKGITLDEALKQADALSKEILPEGFLTSVKGQAEEMKEAFGTLLLTFFLAIVMIYLILSAQFESFVHPVTVMAALPLSLIGALGLLFLTGMTINMYSIIGIILLMGLVTKNSILLVDYTNTLRRRGKERHEAIEEAGRVRLRPILMTALSTIIGIVPIALGIGAGAESRQPLGMAVVGGMTTSTFLTLFVVPVIYTLLDDMFLKAKHFFKPETQSL